MSVQEEGRRKLCSAFVCVRACACVRVHVCVRVCARYLQAWTGSSGSAAFCCSGISEGISETFWMKLKETIKHRR